MLSTASGTATATARPTASAGGKLPTPIVRLDTPGDYPHNGLSGFAFDFAGNVYFGLGENLGADYRLIGSDGTTLSGGGEGGNIYRCRPDGSKLERVATGFWNPFHMTFDAFGRLFAVDNDPDSRPPCRLLHIVRRRRLRLPLPQRPQGAAPVHRLERRAARHAAHGRRHRRGAERGRSRTIGTNFPPTTAARCSSPRGATIASSNTASSRTVPRFAPMMKPVVIGGDDFRPVGIATAPDGSLYVSDWVDKSYTLHGKGRIWRLRSADGRPVAKDAAVMEAEPCFREGTGVGCHRRGQFRRDD